jgi:transcriptional regulator with XRE-family HTH domain
MLTGDQIAAGRRLAGIRSQAELAVAAGVSRPTIERAEAARGLVPSMNAEALARIVRALEAAGVEFYLQSGATLAGGVGMRLRATEK